MSGRVENADRFSLGLTDLIVHDGDEEGRIVSVGLSVGPSPPPVPMCLSDGEVSDRVRRFFAKRPQKPARQDVPATTSEGLSEDALAPEIPLPLVGRG